MSSHGDATAQDYRLVALPVCLAQAFDSLKEGMYEGFGV